MEIIYRGQRAGPRSAERAPLNGVQVSPSAARKAHRVLSLVLALAVRDGRLARNPADHIALPREPLSVRRYLSHAEVRALASACAEPDAAAVKRRLERGDRRADFE